MSELPPGFRFYPTEEELVCFYLRSKLDGRRSYIERVIPVVADVCALDPWQLPEVHRSECAGGEPWFYFCPRQEREARGGRPCRTTPSGFWKAAGTPGWVYAADGRPIGSKKTMVFYLGRAPAGTKTEWKMHEYRALEDADVAAPPRSHALQLRSEFSLCRLYTKSGCPRQFDRRPSAAAAAVGGGSQTPPPPSSSTAALANVDETGKKRKRSPQNDDTSSSDGDGGPGHSRQRLLEQDEGTGDELIDGMVDWTEFLDWL